MRRRRFDHDDPMRVHRGPRPSALRSPIRDSAATATHPVLSLQRTIGNRAVARAIEAGRMPQNMLQRDAAAAVAANANPWLQAEATTQFMENYAELPKLMAAMHKLKSLSHIPAMESVAGLSEDLAVELTSRTKVEERVQLFSAVVSGISTGLQAVKLEVSAAGQQHTSPGAVQVSDAGELARACVETLKTPAPVPSADPRAFFALQKLQIKALLMAIEELVKSALTSSSQGGTAGVPSAEVAVAPVSPSPNAAARS